MLSDKPLFIMKKYILFFLLVFNHVAKSQEIMGYVIEENIPVYLLRTEESKIINRLEPSSFVYIEDSPLSMVKVNYYHTNDQSWTEGFVDKMHIKLIGNASKGEKVRFYAAYLKKYAQTLDLNDSNRAVYTFQPVIDDVTTLICGGAKILAPTFLEIIFYHLPHLDEKQIFALEEIKDCQASVFQTAFDNLLPHQQQQLSELISGL